MFYQSATCETFRGVTLSVGCYLSYESVSTSLWDFVVPAHEKRLSAMRRRKLTKARQTVTISFECVGANTSKDVFISLNPMTLGTCITLGEAIDIRISCVDGQGGDH